MYIEMVDETGQVSDEILKQTQEILEFAAQKLGKKTRKWLGLCNQWTQSWTKSWIPWYGSSDGCHQFRIQARDGDFFDEEDLAENPELAEMMAEFDTYIGELFISIDKAREQAEEYGHSFEREMGFLAVHGFLHINGYDHYTPEEEKEMFGLQEEILTAYGLTRQ